MKSRLSKGEIDPGSMRRTAIVLVVTCWVCRMQQQVTAVNHGHGAKLIRGMHWRRRGGGWHCGRCVRRSNTSRPTKTQDAGGPDSMKFPGA